MNKHVDQILLSEIFVSASTTATLTQRQREELKQLLLSQTLDSEETASVDRLLRAIRRGSIKVVQQSTDEFVDCESG